MRNTLTESACAVCLLFKDIAFDIRRKALVIMYITRNEQRKNADPF